MLKKMLKSYDYSLIFAIVLLCGFGLVMVYSSSMITAVSRYGVSSNFFFMRQLFALIAGGALFILMALFPYKALAHQKFQKGILLVSVLALISLFVFGHVAGNAQSWFKIGGMSIQPGEFVKLVVILYLAAVYAKKQSYIDHLLTGVAPPVVMTLIICGLIAMQPDFGTAMIIGLIATCMILCSGFSGKTLVRLVILGGIVFILVSPIIYLNQDKILTEGRLARFESLEDPFKYANSSGLQVINSYYAISSGGIFGLGSVKVSKNTDICLNHTLTLLWLSLLKSSAFLGIVCDFLIGFCRHKRFLYCQKMRGPVWKSSGDRHFKHDCHPVVY